MGLASMVAVLSAMSAARAFSPSLPSSRALHPRRSTGRDPLRSGSGNEGATGDGPPADAIVVGAGPAGLLAAIVLAQKLPPPSSSSGGGGVRVRVFDRRPSPPPSPTDEAVWRDAAKFYLLGIGHRGQRALKAFGVWDDVKAHCNPAPGRMDWAPDAGPDEGVERIFTDRPAVTEVIAREKLVGCMYEHVRDKYGDRIEVNYGFEVTPTDFGGEGEGGGLVKLLVTKCSPAALGLDPVHMLKAEDEPNIICDTENSVEISTNLLVAADGTARTVASAMEASDRVDRSSMNVAERLFAERPFAVTRYVDDNRRIYKTFPMKVPAGWRTDLNYSARSRDGRVTFDALPADGDGNYCGVLLLREDDELAQGGSDPAALRGLLDEFLPQFSRLLDDATVAGVAKKGPSFLPSFRYAGPRLHQGDRTVILGDCAHTVKPYFGLGANTALEDVEFLGEALDSTSSTGEAIRLFSKRRAKDSEILVKLSRGLDHPGTIGALRFILPLIVDSIFHSVAPRLFAPNTLAMFQKEGMSFVSIRRRKWIDRVSQGIILGSAVYGLGMGCTALIKTLVSITGRGPGAIVACLATVTVLAGGLQRASFLFLPGLAPADVMPKSDAKDAGR